MCQVPTHLLIGMACLRFFARHSEVAAKATEPVEPAEPSEAVAELAAALAAEDSADKKAAGYLGGWKKAVSPKKDYLFLILAVKSSHISQVVIKNSHLKFPVCTTFITSQCVTLWKEEAAITAGAPCARGYVNGQCTKHLQTYSPLVFQKVLSFFDLTRSWTGFSLEGEPVWNLELQSAKESWIYLWRIEGQMICCWSWSSRMVRFQIFSMVCRSVYTMLTGHNSGYRWIFFNVGLLF